MCRCGDLGAGGGAVCPLRGSRARRVAVGDCGRLVPRGAVAFARVHTAPACSMSADAAAAAALDAEENVSAKMGEDAAAEEVVAEASDPEEEDDPDAVSDDDESEAGDLEWNIGFVEEAPASELVRQFFPSKLGGRPAWLDPVDVPTAKQLKCLYTREPLDFLLQLYAPVDDEPTAFHRALYVFISPHGGDLHRLGAVRVFRSQLPRENPFYPDEPAEPGGPLQELTDEQQAAYDVREDRWADRPTDVGSVVRRPKMFPEFELAVEPEELEDENSRGSDDGAGSSGNGKLATADEDALPEELRGKGADVSERELRELERMQDKDQVQLSQFHLRLRRGNPTQVVRYCFDEGAKPLWPSVTHAPVADEKTVPPCPRCGAARRFEFQVLPQIINHLEVDSELASAVDFGAIAVYTCSESCAPTAAAKEEGISAAYAEEIVLVHPPLNA